MRQSTQPRRAFGIDGAEIYADHRDMLREIHPDLVAVATDSGSHAALAVDCIDAGCHVLIEKPLALSLSDADKSSAARRKWGVVAAVCPRTGSIRP
jgi:predicted dehydrogenase